MEICVSIENSDFIVAKPYYTTDMLLKRSFMTYLFLKMRTVPILNLEHREHVQFEMLYEFRSGQYNNVMEEGNNNIVIVCYEKGSTTIFLQTVTLIAQHSQNFISSAMT